MVSSVILIMSRRSPVDFAEEVVKVAGTYNGFNLILADLCSKVMVYVSNRPKGEPISVQLVCPGLHVLSNAKLNTPWHKTERLRNSFEELLKKKHGEEEVAGMELVEKLMGDTIKADRDNLANTGCDPEWEYILSSIFVEADTKLGRYGTRSMAALSVKANGDANMYERHLEDLVWKEHEVQYHIGEER